jgi:hypothetical protein
MPALSECLACHASSISDKRITKTSTDDDQKKVRTTRHTRVDNGHLLANRYAFTRPHARKKETHEVVDERIKKTWPKIQWWTIINA